MARQRWISSLALASLLCASFPAALSAQETQKKQQDEDVMNRPRNEKKEASGIFKKWIEVDVAYIITPDERRAYKKLQTDEEREQFIEGFWRRRDPDPDTEENEYKDEYYERIAYANQHFASGIPGWKTDRGRIYIMYGPPHEKESHPAGGSYQRESYEGGGQTSTYPFERWFYRHIPGVGSGVEIEFVDPTGSGEYRIARSPNEKDALLHVPGAGLTLAEQLGLANKGDRINYGGFGMANYQRQQDSPFDYMERYVALNKAPEIQGAKEYDANGLTTTTSGTVESNPIDFDMKIDFYRQTDDRVVTAFTIQAENNDLRFVDVGGVQTARLNIFGRVTSVAGRRITTFEDPVTTSATVEELSTKRDQKSAYQRAVILPPGTYKVDVMVRDINSGAQQIKNIGFTVPKYAPNQLSTSTLVLAAKLQSMVGAPPSSMFTIGNYKVLPNVSGRYRRGDDVGIYAQIYNAGIDQTTLRPSVEAEYVLMKDGKEVFKQAEDWRGLSDSGQRLTLARLLPTAGLSPGEYEIVVRIRDSVSGQSLAPSAKFTLLDSK
ncbi:MAG TPA: GWxTD domain-containing protein [Pyrinomonadaceae bacterium]|nr:GWxTD domain-containing protein [Pyrinomonadaceae bacterium]